MAGHQCHISTLAIPTINSAPYESWVDSINPKVCLSDLLAYSTKHGIAFTCVSDTSTLNVLDLSSWLANSSLQDFSFSPDKHFLAFAGASPRQATSTSRLFLVDFAKSNITLMRDDPLGVSNFGWSADGGY